MNENKTFYKIMCKINTRRLLNDHAATQTLPSGLCFAQRGCFLCER